MITRQTIDRLEEAIIDIYAKRGQHYCFTAATHFKPRQFTSNDLAACLGDVRLVFEKYSGARSPESRQFCSEDLAWKVDALTSVIQREMAKLSRAREQKSTKSSRQEQAHRPPSLSRSDMLKRIEEIQGELYAVADFPELDGYRQTLLQEAGYLKAALKNVA